MRLRRKKREMPKVNTSSMPDIIFMLLFFFMVSTSIQSVNSVDLTLPEINLINPPDKEVGKLILMIQSSGEGDLELVIENSIVVGFDRMKAAIQKWIAIQKGKGFNYKSAVIWADEAMPVGRINEVKNELQRRRIFKVEFVYHNSH